MATTGDNSTKLLKSYAERIAGLMGQIGDIKEEVRNELKAAKSAGLDIKALNKVVRDIGMDEEAFEKQLAFEWEVDAYRKIVGLKTEIAGKQEAA